MKIEEVPQESGMIGEGYGREVCYAVDGDGHYILSSSSGWDPKNVVNDQAWELITEETRRAYEAVRSGKRSPLAFYQARHQMDLPLLATYAGFPRWRVWLHLKPSVFAKLSSSTLKRYADIFSISVDELQRIPDNFNPQQIRIR